VPGAVFSPRDPTLEDYWRGIILLGRNVASYKFALAKALLELRPVSGQLVKLDELALPFARHVAAHLKLGRQGTSASSQFLEACRRFNEDGDTSRLVEQTVRLGFNNVIDAFHVIGPGDIPRRFFHDVRQGEGGIRITDEFTALMEGQQAANLPREVESRWRRSKRPGSSGCRGHCWRSTMTRQPRRCLPWSGACAASQSPAAVAP